MSDKIKRIITLRNNIARANQIYFNGGERTVTDSTYDGWKEELKVLVPSDPLHAVVGAPVSNADTRSKAQHKHHMGSLNDAMTPEAFISWYGKVLAANKGVDPQMHLSLKMDGCSVSLQYEDGQLVQALTRGDGNEGMIVTANALRMRGVPRYVHINHKPFTGSVRGEVILHTADWKELDPEGESNARNLGNGMAARSDGEDCELLHFYAFRAYDSEGVELVPYETDMQAELEAAGFVHAPSFAVPADMSSLTFALTMRAFFNGEVEAPAWLTWRYDSVEGKTPRQCLPFEIDGLVLKLNSIALQQEMGIQDKRPRGQIAFKFPSMSAQTKLMGVELQVGQSGTIAPVALLKGVSVGGVTVRRATLCNWDEIERLGVAVGDTVIVSRRGDVIPCVEEVVKQGKDRKPVDKPTECPSCHGPVYHKPIGIKGEVSAALYCKNPDCGEKMEGKLIKWLQAHQILSFGPKLIHGLFTRGIVKDVAQLYDFTYRPDAYVHMVSELGATRVEKWVYAIEQRRDIPLASFLGALGIAGLGRRRVLIVQKSAPGEFDSLFDWIGEGSPSKLVARKEQVGLPHSAAKIQQAIDEIRPLILRILAAGVRITREEVKEPVMSTKPDGLTFVLTGKFPELKAFYHNQILSAGHQYVDSFNSSVSHVVTADKSVLSGKTKKAIKAGIPVIDLSDLAQLLK